MNKYERISGTYQVNKKWLPEKWVKMCDFMGNLSWINNVNSNGEITLTELNMDGIDVINEVRK